MVYGPTIDVCDSIHADKYRQKKELFTEAMARISAVLGDGDERRKIFKDILLGMYFGYRQQQGTHEMLQHLTATSAALLKTAWIASCRGLLKLLKQCVGVGALVMTLVLFALVVIELLVLIVPLLVLFLSCMSLMLFAEQFFLLDTDVGP